MGSCTDASIPDKKSQWIIISTVRMMKNANEAAEQLLQVQLRG